MDTHRRRFSMQSAEMTSHRAAQIAAALCAGDVILLEGPVGAGKTHFARALIQSVLPQIEDVPSPTFTLVQTYDTTRGEIWHADLYRIGSTLDIEELGLTDAFETAICLIEWPDRLGPLAPEEALLLSFAPAEADEVREVTASWSDPRWPERLERWI